MPAKSQRPIVSFCGAWLGIRILTKSRISLPYFSRSVTTFVPKQVVIFVWEDLSPFLIEPLKYNFHPISNPWMRKIFWILVLWPTCTTSTRDPMSATLGSIIKEFLISSSFILNSPTSSHMIEKMWKSRRPSWNKGYNTTRKTTLYDAQCVS